MEPKITSSLPFLLSFYNAGITLRKYFQWSSVQMEKLYKNFGIYIKDKKDGWPGMYKIYALALTFLHQKYKLSLYKPALYS